MPGLGIQFQGSSHATLLPGLRLFPCHTLLPGLRLSSLAFPSLLLGKLVFESSRTISSGSLLQHPQTGYDRSCSMPRAPGE